MNTARTAKLNKYIANDYSQKFKNVMTESGVTEKPQWIFNIYEKGCRLNLPKQQTALVKK